MLILTRLPGQTIRIANDVEVTILGVNGMQVRVGVKAPRQIPVHREEIWQIIQARQSEDSPPGRLRNTSVRTADNQAAPAKSKL